MDTIDEGKWMDQLIFPCSVGCEKMVSSNPLSAEVNAL